MGTSEFTLVGILVLQHKVDLRECCLLGGWHPLRKTLPQQPEESLENHAGKLNFLSV